MPIYEYFCTKCENFSEMHMKISSPHPDKCLNCGAVNTMQKQLSKTSFVLKGEGWYETDFKNKTETASNTSKLKNKTSNSTDTKPVAKGSTQSNVTKEATSVKAQSKSASE